MVEPLTTTRPGSAPPDRNGRLELSYAKAPYVLPLIFAPQFLLQARRHWTGNGDFIGWLFVGFVVCLIVIAISMWVKRGFSRRCLVIDDEGVSLARWRGYVLPWSQIRACSGDISPFRRELRLYLRPSAKLKMPRGGAARPGAVPALKIVAGNILDIDLREVVRAARAVDEAVDACALHLARANGKADAAAFIVDPITEAQRREAATSRSVGKLLLVAVAIVVAAFAAIAFVALAQSPLGAFETLRRLGGYRPLVEEAAMAMDSRPAQKILFLGNSRIVTVDLPRMVRAVADSAHSPIRYDLHMRAWADATLKEHWNFSGDREALQARWDLVILQTHSSSFFSDTRDDTAEYGAKLIAAAKAPGSRVALIQNWGLGPRYFPSAGVQDAAAYEREIATQTQALAKQAGADVFDLEAPFVDARERTPDIALTLDGNHLSAAGAYLAALVLYGDLSGADVSLVSYRPSGVSEDQAAQLRALAARHVPFRAPG